MANNAITVTLGRDMIAPSYKQKRDCYAQIGRYMERGDALTRGKVLALYGLRRTGKTIMMQQYIAEMPEEEKKKTAYMECSRDIDVDMNDLYDVMRLLYSQGIRNFFIDEVTGLNHFCVWSGILANTYSGARGGRVVIAGTDSLAVQFASEDALYDRIVFVHTSYVPYAEYRRLIGGTLDDYIVNGGTLAPDIYRNYHDCDRYTNTAIVDNILHSLRRAGEGQSAPWPTLLDIGNTDAVKSVIQKMINLYSYQMPLMKITEDYKCAPLGSGHQILAARLPGEDDEDKKDEYDKIRKEITRAVKNALGILNKEEVSDEVVRSAYDEIKAYLQDLGLLVAIPQYQSFSRNIPSNDLEIILQPGMLYAHAEEFIKQLESNEKWNDLSTFGSSEFKDAATGYVVGRILERIVLADTFFALSGANTEQEQFYVSQLSVRPVSKRKKTGDVGYAGKQKIEADMIVVDRKEKQTYLFEIKHSDKDDAEHQTKNLTNEDFLSYIDENFAPVKKIAVVYMGPSGTYDGIPYLNAEDFLEAMHETMLSRIIINAYGESILPEGFDFNEMMIDAFPDAWKTSGWSRDMAKTPDGWPDFE